MQNATTFQDAQAGAAPDARAADAIALRSIFFPSDMSPESDRAFEHAALLARQTGAHVTLCHVVPVRFRHEPSDPADPQLEVARRAEVQAREHFERHVAGLGDGFETLVTRGPSVASSLIKTAASLRPDLVVMATHGHAGFAHFVLGSVAEALLQRSPAPVLFVREPDHGVALPYRRILVPTDLSQRSRRAFPWAALLARSFGADVVGVHASPPPPAAAAADSAGVEYVDANVPSDERLRAFLGPQFDGLRVLPRVFIGSAWDRIVETARVERADLIVMSTHGHDSLADRVVGSHAERVVRHAPCPVLVV